MKDGCIVENENFEKCISMFEYRLKGIDARQGIQHIAACNIVKYRPEFSAIRTTISLLG